MKLPTDVQLFFQTFNGFSIEWDVQIKGSQRSHVCVVIGWLHGVGLRTYLVTRTAEGSVM